MASQRPSVSLPFDKKVAVTPVRLNSLGMFLLGILCPVAALRVHWIVIGYGGASGYGMRQRVAGGSTGLNFLASLTDKCGCDVKLFVDPVFGGNDVSGETVSGTSFLTDLHDYVSSLNHDGNDALYVYIKSQADFLVDGQPVWDPALFVGPDGHFVAFDAFLDEIMKYRGGRVCLFVDCDFSSEMCLALRRSKPTYLTVDAVASSMGKAVGEDPYMYMKIIVDALRANEADGGRNVDYVISHVHSKIIGSRPLARDNNPDGGSIIVPALSQKTEEVEEENSKRKKQRREHAGRKREEEKGGGKGRRKRRGAAKRRHNWCQSLNEQLISRIQELLSESREKWDTESRIRALYEGGTMDEVI